MLLCIVFHNESRLVLSNIAIMSIFDGKNLSATHNVLIGSMWYERISVFADNGVEFFRHCISPPGISKGLVNCGRYCVVVFGG